MLNNKKTACAVNPTQSLDKSAQIKAFYPYFSFDLLKARYRIYNQFNVTSKYHQAIILILMDKINGQFMKYHNMNPQVGYGETVPITDECVAEQAKVEPSTVKAVRLLYQKAGLWKVERARTKYGHSRPGVWIYAFIGYSALEPEQSKMMVQEVEEDILEIDFKGAVSTVCPEQKSKPQLTQMSVSTNISEASEQPSNEDYDSVSEVSESSAKKVTYKNRTKTTDKYNYTSSSIEGTNEEEEDKIKAEKPVEHTRNEPTQAAPSIVEEALVKVSKIRMDETGNPNPVTEAEKKQFRIWLDDYAKKRSKDMKIDYEQALEILPLAWDSANKNSRFYRPDTPMYFCNGRSHKYAIEYLYEALERIEDGEGFERQEQQEATMGIENILGQDFGQQAETNDEYEVRAYIQKFKAVLIQGSKFWKCPVDRMMQGEIAQRLGKETVEKLLKQEGVIS